MQNILNFIPKYLDQLAFNTGVFLLILAALGAVIYIERKGEAPGWRGILFFAIFQAFSQGTEMLSLLFKGRASSDYIAFAAATISYVFLGVFVYSWLKKQGRRTASIAGYLILIVCSVAVLFLFAGRSIFNTVAVYSILFPIILAASASFFVEGLRAHGKVRFYLCGTGVGLLSYSVFALSFFSRRAGNLYLHRFGWFSNPEMEGLIRISQMLSVLIVVFCVWRYLAIRGSSDSAWPGWRKVRFAGALVVAVIVISGSVVTVFLGDYAEKQVFSENDGYLEAIRSNLEYELGNADDAVESLSEDPGVLKGLLSGTNSGATILNSILNRYQESFHLYLCYIMTPEGKVLASSNPFSEDIVPGEFYSDREYFREVLSSGTQGRVIGQGINPNFFGYYSARSITRSGEIVAVVAAKNALSNKILGSSRSVVIVDRDGSPLLASDVFFDDGEAARPHFWNGHLARGALESYLRGDYYSISKKLGGGRWDLIIFFSTISAIISNFLEGV